MVKHNDSPTYRTLIKCIPVYLVIPVGDASIPVYLVPAPPRPTCIIRVLSLSISIYMYVCVYIYIYIYIMCICID